MNKKLKIDLRRRSSEQGFAIPIAMGLGLVMLLVGVTMIVRSQEDTVTASAQKATTDSLGVAETGITRVQSLLKRFPKMAQNYKSNWSTLYTNLSSINDCLNKTQYSDIVTNIDNWIKVDSSDLQKGEFKILSYSYTGNAGTLRVAGRATSENGSANTSAANATTYLEVNIPVVPVADFPIPGLWAKNYSMGNNDVSGNILVSGCSIPSGVSTANIVSGTGSLNANASIEFPPLPSLPSINFPPVPTQLPGVPLIGYYQISAITSPITLPRDTDVAGSDGVYRYLVNKDGSGNSIALNGNASQALTITVSKKVTLYLQGNINMSGSSRIIHTGALPSNFQIYGSDGGANYKNATDTNSYTTTSITLSGNTSASMFIYAPKATVGVNGGGSQPSTITGSVWANTWDGSNANQLVVTQLANWTDLLIEQPKSISTIQSWQRQQASN